MLAVLRNRAYRHLVAAQVVALVGTGLATVALGLLAYDIAGADAGSVLGTALAIKMVAYVLIAPATGAVADRLPRRALMVTADLTRAGVALFLPFVDQVWQVYVLVFLSPWSSPRSAPSRPRRAGAGAGPPCLRCERHSAPPVRRCSRRPRGRRAPASATRSSSQPTQAGGHDSCDPQPGAHADAL